jgi:predicted nucleotide-binding protein (sugar kinase/HSP70/actin superfamily)
LDRGATELGMGACHAYCRFGYYFPVQKLILEDMGYDNFKFITIDYESPLEILKTLKQHSAGLNYLQTLRAVRFTYIANRLTDLTDEMVFHYRALELEKGLTDRIAKKIFRRIVDDTPRIRDMFKLQKEIPKIFEREIEIDHTVDPIKIGIIGEIYVVLEPALNVDIHRRLNELGVVVEHSNSLRRFIDLGYKLNPFRKMPLQYEHKAAKPYVAHRLGGETQESIGATILLKKKGFDGMVHLYPFTCMPEIISRAILPTVSENHDMPVMSLVVDEQTGEAGFQTRLEAFVDLLARKKEKQKKKQTLTAPLARII